MSTEKKATGLPGIDWLKVFGALGKVLLFPYGEAFQMWSRKTLPWLRCCSIGGLVGWILFLQWDFRIFKILRIHALYPSHNWSYRAYCCIAMSFGFYCVGFVEWQRKLKITTRLNPVLLNAGLQNRSGEMPIVVDEIQIEPGVFKLTLKRANLPLSRFEEQAKAVESGLCSFIDQITENRVGGTVDILYSRLPMPQTVAFSEADELPEGSVMVGRTRARTVLLSFDETPHVLVGGETTGGKSTFFRQVLVSLYLRSPAAQFTFIDLKEGGEGKVFVGLPRFEVYGDPEDAARALERITPIIKERMELFRINDVPDRTHYLRIPERDRKASGSITTEDRIGRHFVVIDEAQLLFSAGPRLSTATMHKARAAANLLTQQGRAVGIHVLVAAQRPDIKAVDSHTKTNLGAQLCFAMNNSQSSISVIGTGRACEISKKIKGRAIWKCGIDMEEVQTLYLPYEKAAEILKTFKKSKTKEEEEEIGAVPPPKVEHVGINRKMRSKSRSAQDPCIQPVE